MILQSWALVVDFSRWLTTDMLVSIHSKGKDMDMVQDYLYLGVQLTASQNALRTQSRVQEQPEPILLHSTGHSLSTAHVYRMFHQSVTACAIFFDFVCWGSREKADDAFCNSSNLWWETDSKGKGLLWHQPPSQLCSVHLISLFFSGLLSQWNYKHYNS